MKIIGHIIAGLLLALGIFLIAFSVASAAPPPRPAVPAKGNLPALRVQLKHFKPGLRLAIPAGKSFLTVGVNEGGGGGGYTTLPTCSAPFVGVTLFVQGHYWYCSLAGSRASPPYWTLTG